MKTRTTILSLLVITMLFSSCSDEKTLANRLEGLWTISVYQKSVFKEGVPVLEESGSYLNDGTFEFYDNGKGKFIVLWDLGKGTYFDNGDFTWTNTADVVSIKHDGITEKFDVIKNSKDKMEFIAVDEDFGFEGSEQGRIYSMEERIVLVK